MSLANQLGFLHVDEMLRQMTPEEFDERLAHYLLCPWDRPYEVGAMIAAMYHNVMQTYIAAKAGKQPPRTAMLDPRELIPRPRWAKESESAEPSLRDDAVEHLAKSLGCI